jgi:hypothetical protein
MNNSAVSRGSSVDLISFNDPRLAPNGTHFDVVSSDSLGLSGFLRF